MLGIVLYNKEMGTGGAALPDSREVFYSQSDKINRDLESRLSAIDIELDNAHNLIECAPSQIDTSRNRPVPGLCHDSP